MYCSEPGHRITVAIVASRAPGRRDHLYWVVRPLHTMPPSCPSCQRTVYSSKLTHCGYCGAALPADLFYKVDSALRDAIGHRDVACVRALLADGVDLTTTDDEGKTPLMVAAKAGAPEIVELLLEAGADPKPKDKLGYTAEMIAYWYGEYHMGSYTAESIRIVEMLRKVES